MTATKKAMPKETVEKNETVDNDFDLDINENWNDDQHIKDLLKNWRLKRALAAQGGKLDLTDEKASAIGDFMYEVMVAALGDDGMDKLYEHFDGDDNKAVEWFSKKANLSSEPNRKE